MKKLEIVFKDKSKVTYTMKNHVDHMRYFSRHEIKDMESAVLQKYPKTKNEPLKLV